MCIPGEDTMSIASGARRSIRRGLMSWVVPMALLMLPLLLSGCSPTVGDACETSTACGTGLICDLSMAGGYCTRSPCRAGECPAESVCVDFGAEASWCMRRCDGGQGCRSGLSCLDAETIGGETTCLGLGASGSCKICTVEP